MGAHRRWLDVSRLETQPLHTSITRAGDALAGLSVWGIRMRSHKHTDV
jgi:hypothetical protein